MNRYHFLQICEDKFFAEVMVAHYTKLYQRYRRCWKFKAAFLAWKRLHWYKTQVKELEQQQLNDEALCHLLTEINNTDEQQPYITAAIAG